MVDVDLLVSALKQRGYDVQEVIPVPENAGLYEFIVDGNPINLEEARALLEEQP